MKKELDKMAQDLLEAAHYNLLSGIDFLGHAEEHMSGNRYSPEQVEDAKKLKEQAIAVYNGIAMLGKGE